MPIIVMFPGMPLLDNSKETLSIVYAYCSCLPPLYANNVCLKSQLDASLMGVQTEKCNLSTLNKIA